MDKYTWNLKDIYKDEKEYEEDIKKIKEISEEISKLEGKLKEKEKLVKYFNLSEKFSRLEDKISAYAYLSKSINISSEKALKRLSALEIIMDDINEKTIFALPEITKIEDEILKKYINDPDFFNNRYFLEKILEEKKHIYSKEIEQIIDYAESGFEEIFSIYDFLTEFEMPFDDAIDSKGNKYKVTNSIYSKYLESKDEILRKTAMKSRLTSYKKFNKTLASTYIALLKKNAKMIKYRKYDSYLESLLKFEDLNIDIYNNLIESVLENIDIFTKYKKLIYKIYKKLNITEEGKRIKPWDGNLKVFEEEESSIKYEEAKLTVLKGLRPLGEKYINNLKYIFENRYIDVFPRKGKESGGYNLDIYDSHPFILLNYDETYDDITTIAHELGHAMHGILVKENQDYAFSSYNILLAETASTTNEVIMADYLIENEKNLKKKAQKLINFIDTIISTLIIQTMFGKFEEEAFKLAENDQILTPDVLNNLYEDIYNKFYKNIYSKKDLEKETKKEKEEIEEIKEMRKYSWTRVPHFFRPFYVYKYAIGITAAINIYSNINEKKEEYLEKYFDMLKSGGSKKIIDTFKIAEIDLEDKKIYKKIFNFLDQFLLF